MVSLYLRQVFYRVKNICGMAEDILQILRRRIGKPGESSESGDIGKVSVPELADVDQFRISGRRIKSGRERVGGNAVAGGKIICAAGGDVAERDVGAAEHKPAYSLVEGTVASDAYNKVEFRRVEPCKVSSVALFSGGECRYGVTPVAENLYDVRQKALGHSPP